MATSPILDVQMLTKTLGSRILFEDICFSIAERQRVGLIARNGTKNYHHERSANLHGDYAKM